MTRDMHACSAQTQLISRPCIYDIEIGPRSRENSKLIPVMYVQGIHISRIHAIGIMSFERKGGTIPHDERGAPFGDTYRNVAHKIYPEGEREKQ
jgi:hypothetical protein